MPTNFFRFMTIGFGILTFVMLIAAGLDDDIARRTLGIIIGVAYLICAAISAATYAILRRLDDAMRQARRWLFVNGYEID